MQNKDAEKSLSRRISPEAIFAVTAEEGACCRICMDPVQEADMASGSGIRLGCRCSASGFDAMHRTCAAQWFGAVRKSNLCEVCSEEAVGLPQEVKAQIRSANGMQLQDPAHGSIRSFVSVPAFVGSYAAFCLLPATISCLALSFFFMKLVVVATGTGIGLTIALSSFTIVHWFVAPRRPVLHILFVASMLFSTVAFTLMAESVFLSWSHDPRVICGAFMGAAMGSLMFYGVGIPLGTLLAWCLYPSSRGSFGGRGGRGMIVCSSHCGQCWRFLRDGFLALRSPPAVTLVTAASQQGPAALDPLQSGEAGSQRSPVSAEPHESGVRQQSVTRTSSTLVTYPAMLPLARTSSSLHTASMSSAASRPGRVAQGTAVMRNGDSAADLNL